MARDGSDKNGALGRKPVKALFLTLSIVLLLYAVVGGTLAYMVMKTASIDNEFDKAYVDCTVNGDFSVTNNGNVDAYIRAAIIITWQDEDGNIYGRVPAPDTDYTLKINTADWTKIGDYWYCTKAGNPNTQTAVLIESCEALASLDSYTLSVEILAQAIQAEPIDAVMAAWGNISGLATISPGGDQ